MQKSAAAADESTRDWQQPMLLHYCLQSETRCLKNVQDIGGLDAAWGQSFGHPWPNHWQAEVTTVIRYCYLWQSVSWDVLGGVCILQPYKTARSNAHNQIDPRPTAACFKLCVLDNALLEIGNTQCRINHLDAKL